MKRTITELLHIAAGVVGTALIASLAAWSVPQVGETIWDVAFAVMGVLVVMGVPPLRTAWRVDRATAGRREPHADG